MDNKKFEQLEKLFEDAEKQLKDLLPTEENNYMEAEHIEEEI